MGTINIDVPGDIVGIWKDRFDENVSSEMIQKELREKTWNLPLWSFNKKDFRFIDTLNLFSH